MTAAPVVRLLALGDAAVLVVLGEAIDERVNARVHRLAAELRRLHAADPRFGAPAPNERWSPAVALHVLVGADWPR